MNLLLVLIPALFLVGSVVLSIRLANKGRNKKKVLLMQILSFVFVCVACLGTGFVASALPVTGGGQAATASLAADSNSYKGLGLIAAAISVGIAGIGGGMAVSSSASAAIGALSENPKTFGKSIILVALGEAIALYGVLVSILILAKV